MNFPIQLLQMLKIKNQSLGYVFLANMSVITWMSKKQTMIALSTTEAEYAALSETVHKAKWLHHLYNELEFIQEPIILLEDNNRSISLTKNSQFHRCIKQIDLWWHWVWELINDSLTKVIDCQNSQQTMNIMIKPLPQPKFSQYVNKLLEIDRDSLYQYKAIN